MTLPSFSIIIPTYQRRDLVCGALHSLAGIDYPGDWDVVVVVDGSTDGTAAAVRALELPFTLTVIEQPNGGLAAARNAGAQRANGEVLLFLDDDMRAATDLLERHCAAYADGSVAVAGWIGLHASSDKGFVAEGVEEWTSSAVAQTDESDPFALYGGHFSVRREAFAHAGGFDPDYTARGGYGREDTDLAVHLSQLGKLAVAPDAKAWQVHTVPSGAMIARAFEQGRADMRFARKHPRHAARLRALSGADRVLDRMVLQWLAHVPGMRRAFAWLAQAMGGPRTFDIARRIQWWAGVHASGGFPNKTSVLVLCYHAIADHSEDPVLAPYSIPAALFEAHVASLLERGFHFVTPDTALAVAHGAARVPARSVLLTFDDGYDDLPRAARTVLGPRKIPALAFLVSGRIGQTNAWDQPAGALPRQLVDVEGAQELIASGVVLGSHSRFHADLTQIPTDEMPDEIAGPRADFAETGLPLPTHFAYPFGEKNTQAKQAVQAAGYDAGWGLADRRVTPASDVFDLPRVMMHSADTLWRFRFKTAFPTLATILRHPPFVKRR